MTIALALLWLAAHGAPAETPRTAAAEPQLLVRTYDLSSAMPWRAGYRNDAVLFPLLLPTDSGWNEPGASEGEVLVERVQSLYASEFESPGRWLRLDPEAHLVARAPETVHQGIAKLLAFMESAFGQTTELVVDVVSLAGAQSPLPSSVLAAADADKLLAGFGKRATYRMRIRAGATGTVELATQQDLVVDYNCEVAQAATILDPIVEAVRTGLLLDARAAPAPGGTWLALAMRDAQQVGDVRDVPMRFRSLIVAQDQNVGTQSPRGLQSLCVENRSLAVNTFLPEGKVLAFQTALDVQSRKSSALVCVRAANKALPAELRFKLDGAGTQGDVRAFQWQFALPPRVRAYVPEGLQPSEPGQRETDDLMVGAGAQRALHWQWVEDPPDMLIDGLRTDDALAVRDWRPWLFVNREEGYPPPETPSEDTAVVLSRLAPSTRLVQLAFTLRRPGAPNAAVARAVLPVRVGETSAFVLGTEQHRLYDYNVEIAQSAAVADPLVYDSFDGIWVVARPEAGVSGDASVVVTARARVQRGEARTFDAQASTIGDVEEATFDRLLVHEKLAFPKDGSVRTIQLGDPSGASGPGALVLDVEMTDVR